MMLRPDPAIWFEILAAKSDGLCLAETLAAAGGTEFESAGTRERPPAVVEGVRLRERFEVLERLYRSCWPGPEMSTPRASAGETLARAVTRIEAWAEHAAPLIDAVRAAEAELAALERWRALFAGSALGDAERAALTGCGGLAAALYVCARDTELVAREGLLVRTFSSGGERCVFVVGVPDAVAQLGEQVTSLGGGRVEAPSWIGAPDASARLADTCSQCSETAARGRARLDALAEEFRLAEAVAEARRGCWCLDAVAALEEGAALCRMTGWTDDPPAMRRALDGSGVPALLRFSAPPPGLQTPLLLRNPWWARPYEVFCRLLGMPERDAADPSAVVAIVFPLLFGYMFGDLGQGLLLAAGGLVAGRRWPLANLFVPAGLSAAFFGVVFGSVFSLPGVIPPLWHEPLERPLPVLVLPLFGGAALMLAGLVLAGVAARWRGQFFEWLRDEGGAVALYVALLFIVAAPAGIGGAPLFGGLAAGAAALALVLATAQGGGAAAVLAAFATSLESVFQLAINTISFVRVGAFAIGHAGLSAALALLAEAAGGGVATFVVVVIGNALIVALEVLVVSVQTTRLLLFEFFTRFFVGRGRAFRPAAPPALHNPEAPHEV